MTAIITLTTDLGDKDFYQAALKGSILSQLPGANIVDITHHKSPLITDINSFLNLSKVHKKARKSFVIVAQDIDFNKCSDKLVVVPSRLEAHDIIEMDEIERDLRF